VIWCGIGIFTIHCKVEILKTLIKEIVHYISYDIHQKADEKTGCMLGNDLQDMKSYIWNQVGFHIRYQVKEQIYKKK